jgi:hypothetical protein
VLRKSSRLDRLANSIVVYVMHRNSIFVKNMWVQSRLVEGRAVVPTV